MRRSSVGEFDGLGRVKIAPSGLKISPRDGEEGGARRAKIDPGDAGDAGDEAYAELESKARVFPRGEARESQTDQGPSRQRAKIGQTPQGAPPPMYADSNLRGSVSNMALELETPSIARRQSVKNARRRSSIKELRAAELASESWCATCLFPHTPDTRPCCESSYHPSRTTPTTRQAGIWARIGRGRPRCRGGEDARRQFAPVSGGCPCGEIQAVRRSEASGRGAVARLWNGACRCRSCGAMVQTKTKL